MHAPSLPPLSSVHRREVPGALRSAARDKACHQCGGLGSGAVGDGVLNGDGDGEPPDGETVRARFGRIEVEFEGMARALRRFIDGDLKREQTRLQQTTAQLVNIGKPGHYAVLN